MPTVYLYSTSLFLTTLMLYNLDSWCSRNTVSIPACVITGPQNMLFPASLLSNMINKPWGDLFYPQSRSEFSFWHLGAETISIHRWLCGPYSSQTAHVSFSIWQLEGLREWCKPWKYCTTPWCHILCTHSWRLSTIALVNKAQRWWRDQTHIHAHVHTHSDYWLADNEDEYHLLCQSIR